MLNILKVLITSFTIFLFNGCGDSDANYNDNPNYVIPTIDEDLINGIVVDGYIKSATVCIDINNDKSCTNDEISDQTDSTGFFGLEIPSVSQSSLITIITTGGTDTSTNKEHTEIFSTILEMYKLDTNFSYTISPITDLVAHSYKISDGISSSDLNESKNIVAEMLAITVDQLNNDPMKSIDMFAISQDLQHTKMMIQKLLRKYLPAQSTDELITLNNKVKTEILEQNFNVYKIIIQLIHNLALTIPDNEVEFVVAQAQELKDTLNSLSKDTSLSVDNLNRLQKSLDIKQDEFYEILQSADKNSTLEVVSLSGITGASITQTIFNTTNAELDESACTTDNGYLSLTGSNISFFASPESDKEKVDAINGISIKSYYTTQLNLNDLTDSALNDDDTGVTIFYPALENTPPSGSKETSWGDNDNYYFAYDFNWVNNNEQTIYVMTPKDDRGLYSCYRYELDSSNSSDINATKVFRYEEL